MSVSRTLCIFFVIFMHTASAAVGILQGRVTDKSTGEGLPGASVRVLGSRQGASCDQEGYYTIFGLQPGIFGIEISLLGFRKVIVKNIEIFSERRTRIDVQLESSAIDLQTVEIIAHRPFIQRDIPATAYAIGSAKIKQLPITSVKDVLALQAGVTLEGNVRGGKTHEVLFLVDGMAVQDLMKGGLSSDLPKSAISEINIFTGGFDVEYGNALSGVVNIVTKTGDNNHVMGLRFEKDDWFAGTWNKQIDKRAEIEGFARGPVVKDQLYYFTAHTVRLSDTQWWQDLGNFFSSPISKEYLGIAKFDVVSESNRRVSAQVAYNKLQWQDYEFTWRYNLSGLPLRTKDSFRLGITFTDSPWKDFVYNINSSYSYLHNHIGEDSKQDISINPYQYDIYLRYIVKGTRNWWADSKQKVYSMKGMFTYQVDKVHLLKFGGEFNQYDLFSDLIKYEPQLTYYGKPIESAPLLNYSSQYAYRPSSGSVFVQDKIEFQRDGAILSIGGRWDFHNPKAERPIVEFVPTRGTEFTQVVKGSAPSSLKQQRSLRIAFSVPTGPTSIFYMNYGQFFQMPLFDFLYSGINPVQIRGLSKSVLSGNPDLQPERTNAWEIGFKQLLKNSYVVSFTYFKKLTSNQVDSKTLVPFDSKFAGDYGFASYVNNAEANAQGVEIIFTREREDNFSSSISYTFMIAEGMSETADQSINYAQWGFAVAPVPHPLSWDQRHTIKVDASAQLWWGIESNIIAIINSPRPYTFFPTRDGFTPADPQREFIPNNVRMKSTIFTNLKISKTFDLDVLMPARLSVYLDSRNVFNMKNVKWYDSNGKIGGELEDPTAFYELRRTRVGLTYEF